MDIVEFIQYEAQLLDERRWDEWLELYDPGAEYWVPMWDDDGTPTRDPRSELSLIYYPSRGGLEDRIHRIRTGKSSASMPPIRTCHMRSAAVATQEEHGTAVRFNWVTHSFRAGKSVSYFGRKTFWLARQENTFRIMKSYTLVCNDLIDQVLDVYHL